jgi:hypothetical protein
MNAAELFERIADTARKYASVMDRVDQVVSWDGDRNFVVVIARGDAAQRLLDHIQPVESK